MSRDFAFRFDDGRFGASFLAMNCPSIESRYTVFLSFFGCYRRLLSIQKLVFPFRKSVGSFRDCAAALETCVAARETDVAARETDVAALDKDVTALDKD